jgi:pyruvate dehydrogenase (quinone)
VNFLLLARPLTDVYRSDRNGLSITSRFQESVNDTDISEPFRAARFGFLVLENAIREIDEFRSELIAFWEFGLLHAAVDDDLAFQVGRHFVCRIHSQHTLRAHTQQDVDLDRLFSDVAVYNARVMGSAHVANVTDLACRTALNFRGVAHLNLPTDIQDEKTDERSKRNVPHHTAEVPAASARLPGEDDILRAASVLNEGKKIAILAGQGALNARTQIVVVAERLKAPIIKALLGKAVVPDDCPYTTGGIGLLGTKASQEALEECDTLLIAGSSFPYIEFYPKPGKARCVQIDIDPSRIGLRYPVEVGIVADCAKALSALLPKLRRNENSDFLESARKE